MSYRRAVAIVATAGLWVVGFNGVRTGASVSAAGALDTRLTWKAAAGLNGWDAVSDIAVDPDGASYVTGRLMSTTFGPAETFIVKVNRDGTVGYSKVISGATDSSQGNAIAVDAQGNAYVAGTASLGFPFTSGDPVLSSGSYVSFVAKLDPAGEVIYSHAISHTGKQVYPTSMAVDSNGQVVFSANVWEGFGPTGIRREDVEVYRLDETGNTRTTLAVIGGSGTEGGGTLALDSSGRIYVGGATYSQDFPTTAGAIKRTPPAQYTYDGFVTVLEADGTIAYSTLLGGPWGDYVQSIDVDGDQNAYVLSQSPSWASQSTSAPFPLTPGAHDNSTGAIRVTKLDASGALVYSARLGGDFPSQIAVDHDGRAFVSGLAMSEGFELTADAFSSTADQISQFVTVLDPAGASLEWSTYLTFPGGTAHGDDVRPAIAIGPSGSLFVGGSLYDPAFLNGDPDEEWFYDPYGETAAEDWKRNSFVLRFGAPMPTANTMPGTAVAFAAGTASVTFATVTSPGTTTMTPIDPASLNLGVPGAFQISGSVQAYEIHTTAGVSAPIQVCLDGSALSAADFNSAEILHGVNGAWVVETTTRNAATRQVCAAVGSLSPFAAGIRRDTTAPTVTCGVPDSAWRQTNASVECRASDEGSGLASSADASFTLTTSVPDGAETAAASTGTRSVCDLAGNCATAGPIAGFRIDRKAPQITIAAPGPITYALNATVAADFACADGGSGIATCNASAVDTTSAGRHTFSVRAVDRGGLATERSVEYVVGYRVTPLFDQTKSHKAGSTVPVKLQLVDAGGTNVSSAAVSIVARQLVRVSSQASSVMEDSGNANPDSTFRYQADGSYIFNLTTAGLATGTYELKFVAGADPTVQAVRFSVK